MPCYKMIFNPSGKTNIVLIYLVAVYCQFSGSNINLFQDQIPSTLQMMHTVKHLFIEVTWWDGCNST
jgi:hypothetical protein